MKPLGHASQGARRVALRAYNAVPGCGEVAVFLSRRTGQAAAVPYSAPDYAWAVRRHAAHLVGVYRDDLGDNAGLLEQLVEDLCVHIRSRAPTRVYAGQREQGAPAGRGRVAA